MFNSIRRNFCDLFNNLHFLCEVMSLFFQLITFEILIYFENFFKIIITALNLFFKNVLLFFICFIKLYWYSLYIYEYMLIMNIIIRKWSELKSSRKSLLKFYTISSNFETFIILYVINISLFCEFYHHFKINLV